MGGGMGKERESEREAAKLGGWSLNLRRMKAEIQVRLCIAAMDFPSSEHLN